MCCSFIREVLRLKKELNSDVYQKCMCWPLVICLLLMSFIFIFTDNINIRKCTVENFEAISSRGGCGPTGYQPFTLEMESERHSSNHSR